MFAQVLPTQVYMYVGFLLYKFVQHFIVVSYYPFVPENHISRVLLLIFLNTLWASIADMYSQSICNNYYRCISLPFLYFSIFTLKLITSSYLIFSTSYARKIFSLILPSSGPSIDFFALFFFFDPLFHLPVM